MPAIKKYYDELPFSQLPILANSYLKKKMKKMVHDQLQNDLLPSNTNEVYDGKWSLWDK